MSKDALALKYRPKSLDEVIGQDVVVKSLRNSFKANNLHHAYIFGGKYGTGKTSLARILAAMLNCKKGPTEKPCKECDNCKAIFSGKSLDVKELDAASSRSIDDIRQLREEIRYAPIDSKKKVVIIDECHSLTGQAAEAALKMIEEPPEHVIFVLATTDTHKLKDTIDSRCISYRFFKIHWSTLFDHLKNVATQEGIEFDDDALRVCAKAASGSVRNSLQNLQNVINYCAGDKLTAKAANEILGTVSDDYYFKLINCIIKLQMNVAIQTIEDLLSDGRDIQGIVDGLNSHLRSLMVAKICPDELQLLEYTDEEIKKYTHQSSEINLEVVLELMSMLVDINQGLSLNLDPQILLEKFIVQSIIEKRKIEARKKK